MNRGTLTPEDEGVRAQMVALLPRLQRFALMLTGTRADADDLVQATCERAIARLDSWARGTALDRWMFKVAHNLHRNQRRDRVNRLRLVEDHGRTQEFLEDGAGRAEAWTALQEVRRKMLALPEEQRAALVLIAIEGLSYQEAADLLEVPVGTVTSRLARAREALRGALADAPPVGTRKLETA
jgi:RNA polymerase sigma-70 factor (ECF subfamily)